MSDEGLYPVAEDLGLGATARVFVEGQRLFDRYVLRQILGRGGMGVVWQAHDEQPERETALKFLPELITLDKEAIADLKRETRRSLELTHAHIVRIYPWGEVWPPPDDAGNYGDQAFASSLPGTGWNTVCLPENDGYPRTSPVGSFRGNVWQWCMDWYQVSMNSDEIRQKVPGLNHDGGGKMLKVLRGGSWASGDPVSLLSSYRNADQSNAGLVFYGFRVVVVVSP